MFSGTSANGNFEEALGLAIDAARTATGAEQIRWKLICVSGVNGGFAPQNDLTVEIAVA